MALEIIKNASLKDRLLNLFILALLRSIFNLQYYYVNESLLNRVNKFLSFYLNFILFIYYNKYELLLQAVKMPQLFLSNSNSSSAAYSSLKTPNLFNSVGDIKTSPDDNWANHCNEPIPIVNPDISDRPAAPAPWNFMLNIVNQISTHFIPICSFVGAETLPKPKPSDYSSLFSTSDLKNIDSNTTATDDSSHYYNLYNLSKNLVERIPNQVRNLKSLRRLSASCPTNYLEYCQQSKSAKRFDYFGQLSLDSEDEEETLNSSKTSIKILIKLLLNYKYVFSSKDNQTGTTTVSESNKEEKDKSEDMLKMDKEVSSPQSTSKELFPSLLNTISHSKQMLQSEGLFAKDCLINGFKTILRNATLPSCNSSIKIPPTPDPKVVRLRVQEDRQRRLRNKSRKRKKNQRRKQMSLVTSLDDSAIMSSDCDNDDDLVICFDHEGHDQFGNTLNTTVVTGEIDDFFFDGQNGNGRDNYELVLEYDDDDEVAEDSDSSFLSDQENEEEDDDYDEDYDEDEDNDSDSDDPMAVVFTSGHTANHFFYNSDSDSDDENSTDETEFDDDDDSDISATSSSEANDEAELELLANTNCLLSLNFLRTTLCAQQQRRSTTTNVCDNMNKDTTCELNDLDSPDSACTSSDSAVSMPLSIPSQTLYTYCTQSDSSPSFEPLSEEEILRNQLFEESEKEHIRKTRLEVIEANRRWNEVYDNDQDLSNAMKDLDIEEIYDDNHNNELATDQVQFDEADDDIFMIDEICDDGGNINESSPAQSHSSSIGSGYNFHLNINSNLKPQSRNKTKNNNKVVQFCPGTPDVMWIDTTEEEQQWMKEYRLHREHSAFNRWKLESTIEFVLRPDHRERIYRERFCETQQNDH